MGEATLQKIRKINDIENFDEFPKTQVGVVIEPRLVDIFVVA